MKGNTITATLIPEHIRFLETHTKETCINKKKLSRRRLIHLLLR